MCTESRTIFGTVLRKREKNLLTPIRSATPRRAPFTSPQPEPAIPTHNALPKYSLATPIRKAHPTACSALPHHIAPHITPSPAPIRNRPPPHPATPPTCSKVAPALLPHTAPATALPSAYPQAPPPRSAPPLPLLRGPSAVRLHRPPRYGSPQRLSATVPITAHYTLPLTPPIPFRPHRMPITAIPPREPIISPTHCSQ